MEINRTKIKFFFLAIALLIVSPIYVPVRICWEERGEIVGCYRQIWQALTFQELT
jgi:hypothetical protein